MIILYWKELFGGIEGGGSVKKKKKKKDKEIWSLCCGSGRERDEADYDKLLLTPGLQLVDCSSVCFLHRLLDTQPILLHVPRPAAI